MKLTAGSQWLRFFRKGWMLMRITTLIILISALSVSAHTAGQTVTIASDNITMDQFFSQLTKQTGYSFLLKNGVLPPDQKVSAHYTNASLEQVLEQTLKPFDLTFKMEEKIVYILKSGIQGPKSADSIPRVSNEIHGRVTDSLGNPMVGASVLIKGSKKGTTTNNSGNFIISGANAGSTLLISFTGYKREEYEIKSVSELKIVLQKSISPLDEIQIIAYGTTTRRLGTGNVSTVSSATIETQPVGNVLAALEDRVPGMLVTQNTGLPGGSYKVQIQGQNSIAQGSDPLFVVDGVPFAANNSSIDVIGSGSALNANGGSRSPLNSINPYDIESITVLKDADATSIYGSRGANGVVLITTKRGKEGKTKIDANFYTGQNSLPATTNWMNTQQYLQMRHQAFANDQAQPDPNSDYDLLSWDTTRYTDLKKTLLSGSSHTTDAELNISGGNANTQFLVGGGFHREGTLFPGNFSDTRGSFHANLTHNSMDKKFNMSLSLNYSSEVNNLLISDLSNYLSLPPDIPSFYDSTGKLNWQSNGAPFANPYSYLLQTYQGTTQNALGNMQLSYRILPNLIARASLGYNALNTSEYSLYPIESLNPANAPTGSSNFGTNNFTSWIIEPQLEYIKTIGKSKIDVLAGGSFQDNKNKLTAINASGYTTDALLGSYVAATEFTPTNYNSQYRYEGFFARINYNWNDQYILNFAGRRDGSSRFGPGKQFGNFGSIGGAWVFTKSDFISRHLSVLSFGKLRASYGSSGNDQIGDYQYLNTWTPVLPYESIPAINPTRLYNPDYSWEINKKFSAGVELGFLNDRIYTTVNWFQNRTNNQLISYTLPAQTGFGVVTQNFPATVQNTGWEFSINSKNIVTKNFSWTTYGNLTFHQNKLVSFPGLATSSYASLLIVGESLNIHRYLHFTGVNNATGVFQFQDVNKDGQITVDPTTDQTVIKNLDPKFYGGIGNTFVYKGFTLDFFFVFRKQNGISYLASLYSRNPGMMGNLPVSFLNTWKNPGDISSLQKLSAVYGSDAYNAIQNFELSDGIVVDASYIKLKNLSLSYQFLGSLTKKWHIQSLRVYLLAQNLLTITPYQGADPETQNINSLPPLRTITGGIQIVL